MVRPLSALVSILLASLAAGPAFYFAFLIGIWSLGRGGLAEFGWGDPGALVLWPFIASYTAFPFAIIPNTIGTALMAVLGGQFGWARTPAAWALAGLIPVLAVTAAIPELWRLPEVPVALIVASVACALVSRAFIRWVPVQA